MTPSTFTTKNEFFSNLSWAFQNKRVETIYDLNIPTNIETTLIYNTNDLCLNKKQFNTLMSVLSEQETVLLVQNDSEEVYESKLPMSYDDYTALNLYSITFFASNKFDWVVIIDEELASGVGVIIANNGLLQKFNSRYKHGLRDIHDLISFYNRDVLRNPSSIQNLTKLLSLLHPLNTGDGSLCPSQKPDEGETT